MSNQEFEVGDEVHYKDEALLYEITSIISDDDCFNVVNPHTGKEYPYRIEPVDGDDFFYTCEDDIELISKGEDIMEADSIAVEVDDEYLHDSFINLINDSNLNNPHSDDNTTTYWSINIDRGIVQAESNRLKFIKNCGYCEDSIYKLSEDWNKINNFIESYKKLEEFKGYEVNYKPSSDEIEIGCQDFRVDSVINLYELMEEMSLNKVEYGNGINGITITKDELNELVEFLRDQ